MNKRIKEVRTHKDINLNQAEFGERIKITATAVSKIETGTSKPSEQTIELILSKFNVNEYWLRHGGNVNMFNETNEYVIDEVANEYKLSDLSKSILYAYLNLSELKREIVDVAIRIFSHEVMGLDTIEGKVDDAKKSIEKIINTSESTSEYEKSSMEYQMIDILSRLYNHPAKYTPSAEFKNYVKELVQEETAALSGKAAPSALPTLDAEADVYAEFARDLTEDEAVENFRRRHRANKRGKSPAASSTTSANPPSGSGTSEALA
ncbi:MAG: helix-turn-helix domain-containing protein [Defluviitaleaceae bacterium]|nr:helix-turn-helix domain-containing protein [Defluviitaleaceae bacterium]